MLRRTGPNEIIQRAFVEGSDLNKVSDALPVGTPFTTDMTSSVDVSGRGSILRVRVSGATLIAFSDDKAALDAATINSSYVASPCVELPAAGTYIIACPARWAKADVNPVRKELTRA